MTSSEFVTSICEIFSRAEFLIIRHFKKWFPCPDEVIVYLHITFGGVKALIKWFWGHPLHRKLFGLPWAVYIFIYLSHQPKVCHFDLVAMANEDITGSKVSVNKPVFREMILLKIEEIYGIILLHEIFLQFDWLRAVVYQLNLKYLHVKITNLSRVVV